MRKMKFMMVLTLVFCVNALFAQNVQITGTVTSATDGLGIPGANVLAKGTTIGGVTDIDGKFNVKIPSDATTLVFSYMGYKTIEVDISGRKSIDVVLEEDALGLDEVVVVAYGTAKKSSFTGSVGSVSEKKLSKLQVSDPAKALEGAVAGVNIVSTSGQPGQDASIRIRGIGSINASSSPLIIVDGAPYEGSLTSISNNEIKSMNVLKDAASAALYGARGANGVIVITTKRGEKGSTKVKFDAKAGYNYRGVPEYDIMTSPSQYYETFWEALYNQHLLAKDNSGNLLYTPDQAAVLASAGSTDGTIKGIYETLGYNIYDVDNKQIVGTDGKLNPNAKIKYKDGDFNDWEKHLYEPQMRQEYNLSISKGGEKNTVYFSAGYLEDKGYSANTHFDRLSTKVSFDSKVYDWLDVKMSSMFSKTTSNWGSTGSSYTNPFQWTRSIAPIYPVYLHDANGDIMTDLNGKRKYDFGESMPGVNEGRAYGGKTNPVATQKEDKRLYENYYLTNNFGANVQLPFGLKFSTNVTWYGNWYSYSSFTTPLGGAGKTYNGISYKTRSTTSTLNMNQILRWEKEIADVNVNLMAGHETYKKDYSMLYGEKSNYLDPSSDEFNNAAKIGALTSYGREYILEGYFAQATFDYKRKYYLSASFRRDGSSVFHPDNRWGNFYSVGASWRIKEESFLKSVDMIDNLKLKASYGAQGNDYLYLPNSTSRAYNPYKTLYSVTSDGTDLGFEKKYLGRKEVTWEKNLNFNVGLEFSFLNSLIAGEFEYFNRKTDDLLFNLPVPTSTGFTSEPWNIGNMENVGFELSLNSNVIRTEDFRWNINANATHYTNKITKLPEIYKEDGITNGSQILKEGGSIYDFWMVEYAGVDQANGDALYWMWNKSTEQWDKTADYTNTDYDLSKSRKKVGSAIPDITGGFGSTWEYKGFDLSVQFAYQIGGLVNDGVYSGLMHAGTAGTNWHKDIEKRWTPTNTNTDVPRIEFNNQDLTQSSDRFITDASYLAFKNLSFGYNFPKKLTKKMKVSNLRAYFVADNIALWSKRKGLDPRMSFSGVISTSRYAPIRTMSLGLVVNL